MFEYFYGILTFATAHKLVLEVNDIGYQLFISLATFDKLPAIGSKCKIFITAIIREDSEKLFGFLTKEERDFFDILNTVSGIGPRLAIALLSHMSLPDLALALENSNAVALSKVPGVGKKMAERLALELRGKIPQTVKEGPLSITSNLTNDATSALVHLGYSLLEAQKTIQILLQDKKENPPSLSELLALALKSKKEKVLKTSN